MTTPTAHPNLLSPNAFPLTALGLLVLALAWATPLQLCALAAGYTTGATARHALTRFSPQTRAGPHAPELATGLLWTLIATLWQHNTIPTTWLPPLLTLTALTVPLSLADFHTLHLPRALTIPLAILTPTTLLIPAPNRLLPILIGTTLFALPHLALHLLTPTTLSRGDVIIAFPLGAIHGALGPATILPAVLLAALTSLALATTFPHRFTQGIPHAPGMLAATTALALLHATP
ncbi:hypothetical protein [Actinokineospora pegani]|uniref:hypothetical protein n=1 Tax=Actinokineospora pegani TaxID=2654637 RepID=UPI0012EA74F7|nr:hypothetical protein [Actinokineospora pegani]